MKEPQVFHFWYGGRVCVGLERKGLGAFVAKEDYDKLKKDLVQLDAEKAYRDEVEESDWL